MAARRRSGGSGRPKRAAKAPKPLYSPEPSAPRAGGARGIGNAARGRAAPTAHANEFAAAAAAVRSQVSKYRTAVALLDAYELDGWRGASREKLRPEAELAAARRRILEAKLRIRECLRVIDEAGGHVSIPAAAFDPDGEVDEADVFCAVCREHESTDDNDIVLCDGDCRRAYHLQCLTPPLRLEDLPPDEEGWLCPACDAKVDAIWLVNTAFGMELSFDVPWSDVFAIEAAAAASGGGAAWGDAAGGDDVAWPSDEEEDEDFDPAAPAARLASPRCGGAASDADGESDGDDEEGEEEEEEESETDEDAAPVPRRRTRALAAAGGSDSDLDVDEDAVLAADAARSSSHSSDSSDSESEQAPVLGKRRRAAVDYVALNAEMFGDGGSDGGGSVSFLSDDDDWRSAGPASPRSGGGGGGSGLASPRSTGGGARGGAGLASPPSGGGRGRHGFGPAVTSLLEAAFAREPLPNAAAKAALASRTSLSAAQVNTWFSNRRQRIKRDQGAAAAAAAAATPASRRRSSAGGAAGEVAAAAGASGGKRAVAPLEASPAAPRGGRSAAGARSKKKEKKKEKCGGAGGPSATAATAATPKPQPPRSGAAAPSAAAAGGVGSPPGRRFPPAVAAQLEALYGISKGTPSEAQRVALMAATGLTRLQVRTWFMNQRSRRNTPGRR